MVYLIGTTEIKNETREGGMVYEGHGTDIDRGQTGHDTQMKMFP